MKLKPIEHWEMWKPNSKGTCGFFCWIESFDNIINIEFGHFFFCYIRIIVGRTTKQKLEDYPYFRFRVTEFGIPWYYRGWREPWSFKPLCTFNFIKKSIDFQGNYEGETCRNTGGTG